MRATSMSRTLFALFLVASTALPAAAGGGTLSVSCGVVCGTYSISCGGHLQPACASGDACDGNNVLFTLPNPYTYTCPGFPCNGSSHTFTQGCYDPTNPPTCAQCSGPGQYQCVPATGCGGRCDAGLTPDANGFCVSCGGNGQIPCADGDPTCDAGHYLAGSHCYADGCGDSGETACGTNPLGECYAWNNYIPVAHQCVACGDEFEVTCDAGAECLSGLEVEFDSGLGYGLCANCGGNQERVCLSGAPCREPGVDVIGPNLAGVNACGVCGGNNPQEIACYGATPCDPGLTHITDDILDGDITDCLGTQTAEERHYVAQNGFCTDLGPAPMVRTAPENWPPEEDSAGGRNTVLRIHGRGASCGGSMDNVLDSGGLYAAGHLTYCVQYAQEGNPGIDDRAVRILGVSNDTNGIESPDCVSAGNCQFDRTAPVIEVLAPTPAGATPSVAEVVTALRDAILQLPIEGDLTLIGHSQGGFIARELVYGHYDELRWAGRKISRVITLQHPYYTKHASPMLYTPWTCWRENNFDCSTGRWTWGWELNATGLINDGDYPQIEWTAGSGGGVLGAESEDANGDGVVDATDDACLYNFGGIWADDVLYDTSVPIESSLGYDEFGFFTVQDLPFDRKVHGTGTHTASFMLSEMLQSPAPCQPGSGVGSPPDSCQGVDAENGILPYSTDAPRTPDALEFDGIDDRVTVDDPAAIAALDMSDQLTIDVWVYPAGPGNTTNGSGSVFVNKEGEYWLGRWSDGRIAWAVADGNWVARLSTATLPDDTWSHVALTFDGTGSGQARLFVNGAFVESWSVGVGIGDVSTGENRLDLGERALGTQPFDGRLDDVRVWDTALTDTQVRAILDGQPASLGVTPVVWYKFDESTDTLVDSSGHGHHGSIATLGASRTPTRKLVRRLDDKGGSLYLDGVDDRAVTNDPGAIARLDPVDELTVEGWMFLRSHDFATMLVNSEGAYWLSASNAGRVGFAVASASPGWVGTYSDYDMPLRTWTHVAFVYDNDPATNTGIARIYVNGQLEKEWNIAGPIGDVNTGNNTFALGGRPAANTIHGTIDEVRVWNVARSAAEIAAHYNRTLPDPASETGLIGYWTFDERYGPIVFDRSGQGNHLTLGDGTPGTEPLRTSASQLPGYRLIYDGDCGNGFVDPLEDCDDGSASGGDGCSAACRLESVFDIMGTPMGGTVSIDVAGVTVSVTTAAGQTADEVAAALAAAIEADALLASLGIRAASAGDQVFIGGDYGNVVITDPGLMDCASVLAFPTIQGPVTNGCPDTAVTLAADPGYAAYQWLFEGQPIDGADGPTYTATLTGDYSVRVGDGSGCERESYAATTFVAFCPDTEISPEGAVFPLRIEKNPASPTGYYVFFQSVDGVDGFHLYEGDLGAWYDHGAGGMCGIGACPVPNETGCFDDLGDGRMRLALGPGTGDRYYLISGYQGSDQGPTGYDGAGNPRDPSQSTCSP